MEHTEVTGLGTVVERATRKNTFKCTFLLRSRRGEATRYEHEQPEDLTRAGMEGGHCK